MALNTSKCNYLTPLPFKMLIKHCTSFLVLHSRPGWRPIGFSA